MKNGKVTVSVIFPVFNGERFISQAVRSVLNQSFKDIELIIIDDASTDSTVKVVRKFEDSRIKLHELKINKGPGAARNIGIQAARGRWVAFIDADDYWHKERLKILLAVADKHPRTFIGSDILVCFNGKNDKLLPWESLLRKQRLNAEFISFPEATDLVKSGLDIKPMIPMQILRKNYIKFNEKFGGAEWLEFILSLYKAGLYLLVVNKPLYYYRITPGSLSSSYRAILNELEMSKHLLSLKWLNESVKKSLREKRKILKYRLLTTSLREKRWSEALHHTLETPNSFLYTLQKYPQYLLKNYRVLFLYKKLLNK
jgi:succinoglycan biosynthesis protein ExoO